MKFFEVGPQSFDDRARDHDPADLLLGQDLQEAAGRPAGGDHQGRQGSRRLRPPDGVLGDSAKLDALEKAGKLKRIAFTDRAEMKKLVDPVMAAYAKEISADAIFAQINAIKCSFVPGRGPARPRPSSASNSRA